MADEMGFLMIEVVVRSWLAASSTGKLLLLRVRELVTLLDREVTYIGDASFKKL